MHRWMHFFEHQHREGRGGRRGEGHGEGRGHRGGRGMHGHGFFGMGGGHANLRAAKMMGSGDLQLVTLALLQDKPRYGYELIKALEEHSSGVYTPSPGMVYPALTYLEEVGHADCTLEGKKKLYSITPEGAAYLAEHRAEVDETLANLATYGRKVASFQRQFTAEENATEEFGRGRGRFGRQEWRELKSEFRDLKDELRAAIVEKLDAPLEEKKRVLQVLREAIASIRNK